MSEAVIAHLVSQRDAILERPKALLLIPSVSTDPQFGAGMRDAREFLLGRFRDLGLKNVQTMDGGGQPAPFFDLGNGGKVRGAERKKERFLMSFAGVDSAGQPRADDQIKMHFDQSTWGDPTIYERFLRLPPGIL